MREEGCLRLNMCKGRSGLAFGGGERVEHEMGGE